ncbi:hypothetical protein [Microbacterium sp.]|uniref:hypothetical protein n=1 Tax=Microbacterium sp. TaxID=51671 RepID=UPI003C245F13
MALSWLGELVRLERASLYIRLLEKQLADSPEVVAELGYAPLRFHSTAVLPHRESIVGVQVASQLGIASGFFGTALASELMFVIVAAPLASTAGPLFPWVAVVSAVLQASGLIWCLTIGRRLLRMNRYPRVTIEDTDRIIPNVPPA